MIDPHELPDEAWENSVQVPLSDPPEHVATIRVMDGSLSKDQVRAYIGMMSKAEGPVKVEIVFGTKLPPPLFVTVPEAAASLRVSEEHLLSLISLGWLKPIRYADERQRGARPVAKDALLNETWKGFERRVIWAELVALAEWIREEGIVPTFEPPPKMRRWKTRVRVEEDGFTRRSYRLSVTGLVKQLMSAAVDEDGEPLWLSINTIQDMVLKHQVDAGHASYVKRATVASGVHFAMGKGLVERRNVERSEATQYELTQLGQRGPTALYRWIPEDVRLAASWMKPPASLTGED